MLQQELPDCIVRASFGRTPGVGGVAVIVGPGIAAGLDVVWADEIEPGRVLAVTLASECGQVTVVSIHIDPHASAEQKRGLLRRLRAAIPESNGTTVVLGGDFNWVAPREVRTSWPSMAESTTRAPEARMWDSMFNEFIELH